MRMPLKKNGTLPRNHGMRGRAGRIPTPKPHGKKM
jgi:hypothetical protein